VDQTRKPPPSSKAKRPRSLADRDAGSDIQGPEARDRLRALATKVLSAPYAEVRRLEEQEKGKSGRGRKRKAP
jgi:hypothetical protein